MSAVDGPVRPSPEPAVGSPQFEFGAEENRVFEGLAAKMEFVGSSTALMGGLILLSGLYSAWSTGVSVSPLVVIGAGLLITAIGAWTRRAGVEFQLVAETTGKDIAHVMGALDNLRKLYLVQYGILLVALIFFVLVLVFGLMPPPAH